MRLVPIFFLTSMAVAIAASGIACGSSSSGGSHSTAPDGGSDGSGITPVVDSGTPEVVAEAAAEAAPEAAGYPAGLPTDIPQVATRGGNVMKLPKVYPIFFAGDDPTMTASAQDFVNKVGATNYWKVNAEYGVGAAIGEPAIQLTHDDDPPLVYDDIDIENWLANKLQSKDPAFPAPDANTIYTFFFPAGITITMGGTSSGFPPDGGYMDGDIVEAGSIPSTVSRSCTEFGGYHSAIQLNDGTLAAYAVVPRCAGFDGFTGIDAVTAAASHELSETATDPFLDAYSSVDRPHRYWSSLMGGGEVGDMCAQNLGSFLKFSELPYTVQRIWSNKAALTGLDPCLPVPTSEVYFNTFPIMPDQVTSTGRGLDGGTTTTTTPGVQIAVGSSKTIELDLFSTAATSSPWTVSAYDEFDLQLATAQQLTFTYDKHSGQNADKIHLTIKVVAAGRGNTEPFLIISTLKDGTQNLWAGEVGNSPTGDQ
jgi:hypothetical protein